MIRIRNKLWRSDGYISWFITADLSGLFLLSPFVFYGLLFVARIASSASCEWKGQFYWGQMPLNIFSGDRAFSSESVPMKGKENLRMQTPKVNSILNTFRLVRMWTVQSEFHIQFLPLVFMCLMVMLSWRKSGKMLFFRFYVLYKLVKQLKKSFYMLVPFISGCNGKEIKETIIMIAWHVKKALGEICD